MELNKGKCTIGTLNVRGLRNQRKRLTIKKYLEANNIEICVLQETHSSVGDVTKWQHEWKGKWLMSHGTCKARGTAIWARHLDIEAIVTDPCGRYILVRCEALKVDILGCYAPTQDKTVEQLKFLEEIKSVAEKAKYPLMVAGDLNTSIKKGCSQNSHFGNDLSKWLQDESLKDLWEVKNGNTEIFTWEVGTGKAKKRSRLDYIMGHERILTGIGKIRCIKAVKTDHSLVCVEYFFQKAKRGKGIWRLNISLLKDKEFITKTKRLIQEERGCADDPRLALDMLKCHIRGMAIKHGAQKKKERNAKKQALIAEIEANPEKSEHEKKDLESILEKEAESCLYTVQMESLGSAPNERLLRINRSKASCQSVNALLNDEGELITDENGLIKETKNFYERLYTRNEKVNQGFKTKKRMIPEELKAKMEGEMTDNEIGKALSQLNNGKAPGADGFPVEFYKFFWKDIGQLTCECIRKSISEGEMSIDQKRAIIQIIPKKDKDLTSLKNWRPISLLNCHYKILSKAIANRIMPGLDHIISADQNAYIKGRSIRLNLRTMIDIVTVCSDNRVLNEQSETTPIMCALDFSKAYDCLEHEFIFNTLKHYGFPEDVIWMVRSAYCNVESAVAINGHLSTFFRVTRSVRQGCPLSTLLFLLAAERLADRIKNNNKIEGIKVGQTEIKASQLADDTTLFVQNEEALAEALKDLKSFELASGLRLNMEKCEAMWLGKPREIQFVKKMTWTNKIKCLGLVIRPNITETIQENMDVALQKVKDQTTFWNKIYAPLNGRIYIAKTKIVPMITYTLSSLAKDDDVYTKIEKELFQFIWQNKPPKIKKEVISNGYESGGMRMPLFADLMLAHKFKALTDLKKPGNSRCVFEHYFKITVEELLDRNLKACDLPEGPAYYKELIDLLFKVRQSSDKEAVYNSPVCFNSRIRVDGKIIREKWTKDGLSLTIGDIMQSNGGIVDQGSIPWLKLAGIKAAIKKEYQIQSIEGTREPTHHISEKYTTKLNPRKLDPQLAQHGSQSSICN